MSSNIENYLALIESAVYGRDVRSAIHDAIEECYTDTTTGATAASQAAGNASSAATAASNAATLANTAAANANTIKDKLKANPWGSYNYVLDATPGYWDSDVAVGSPVVEGQSDETSHILIPVSAGDNFRVAIGANYSTKSKPWAIVDSNMNLIRKYAATGIANGETDWREVPLEVFVTESDAAYLLVNTRQNTYPGGYVVKVNQNHLGDASYSVSFGLTTTADSYLNGIAIDNAGFTWRTTGTNASYIFERTSKMSAISLSARTNTNAHIAFLNSIPETYTDSTEVDYISGTGIIDVPADSSQTISIPDGTNYVYVCAKIRGTTRTPTAVKLWYTADNSAVIADPKDPVINSLGNISSGSIFLANGRLYRATASITRETQILPGQEGADGVNCVETTIAKELNRIWAAINAL